ncbi:hypothetical protein STENM223S_06613 [Streptomyces tendae]
MVQRDRHPLGLRELAQGGDQGGAVGARSGGRLGRRGVPHRLQPRFARRQRLTARRMATVRTQASGASSATRRWRGQARTNASCTTSWASPRSPVKAKSWPVSRGKAAA